MVNSCRTQIEVKASFFPLSVFQTLCCPVIEIDGQRHKHYWGTHSFPVIPGRHVIKAWHRWFFFSKCHLSEITVDVAAGDTVRLHWSTPIMVMSPGKWTRVWALS